MTLISKLLRKTEGAVTPAADARTSAEAKPSRRASRLDYCRILADSHGDVSEAEISKAWKLVREHMALVPEGEVLLAATDPSSFFENTSMSSYMPAQVDSFYLDRCCVTNEEFAGFVAAGGYTQEHLWPPEILSNVLQFVDKTGSPGPRYWSDGRPPSGALNHPVTGVCWYEANAFAHWLGKRLPSPAEWQWAVVWVGGTIAGASQRRYPWGDSFDPTRCNTWNSGIGKTVPVDEYYAGCTPNGVYQLIGNVWEWTSSLLECDDSPKGDRILTEFPLAEIRGGAFDTYFASHTTAQFRSGQSLLYRGPNVGFRCCITSDRLATSSDPFSFLENEAKR